MNAIGDLCGDVQLISGYPALLNCYSNFFLVAVHLCTVNVSVPCRDGIFDHLHQSLVKFLALGILEPCCARPESELCLSQIARYSTQVIDHSPLASCCRLGP